MPRQDLVSSPLYFHHGLPGAGFHVYGTLKREIFVKKLSALISIFVLFGLSYSLAVNDRNSASGATPFPDHITLTWTADPATTMTVTWRTDTTVTSGLVQFQGGEVLSSSVQQTEAIARDFTTDLGRMRLFTATLAGLSPNTKYAYRVGDEDHWSSTNHFSTADPKSRSFKFLIFGDSQSSVKVESPYAAWAITIQNAYEANPDAKFMVHVGDLVDYGQIYSHWNAWFDATSGVIDSIPIMPMAGNHECYGSRDTWRPAYWSEQFPLPPNGPEGLKNQVYSYDYGPVHFVVLDSQQFEQKLYGDILAPQKEWLRADLAASEATWKIAFFHKPPYEIKLDRPNEEIRAAFCPVLERYHVDLVFNGHDHAVSRTYPIRDGSLVKTPSMGTIYYIVGRSGDKTYHDVAKTAWNSFFYNPEDQPIYFVVEVDDCKITIQTVKQDGTLVDSFFVDKAEDISSDTTP